MALSLEEVQHIADLARLSLSLEEQERYRQQLSTILDYFARLQAVDVSDLPALSSVLPESTALRPDEPRPGLPTPTLLRTAPQVEDDQFRVPPVFD